jgi:DNA-binding transcriptional MerR regulator
MSSYPHSLCRALGGESRTDTGLDPPPGGDSILGRMSASLTIGDFSRASHLSVKTLRHYHRIGLLEPAEVDPGTGYRRYRTDQIPVAQVIRRFRDLEMPLEEIQAVLAAPDVAARNRLIESHLRRLESSLERTQAATASLRELLATQPLAAPLDLEHLAVAATPAAATTSTIELAEASAWYNGAFGELYASLASQGVEPGGTAGGIFSTDLFAEDRGEATVFIPCGLSFRSTGRIEPLVIPASNWRRPPTSDPTSTSIAPTVLSPSTWPSTHSASRGRSASTTWSIDSAPTTRGDGAPGSAGRSSRPQSPRSPAMMSPAAVGPARSGP